MHNYPTAPHIIIADDHALVRGGIAMMVRLLDKDSVIIEANSYQSTLDALAQNPDVDLVLLDLMMPGLNGLESIEYFCKTWPDVPIVLVTVEENNKIIQSALGLGVSGYIPKSSTPEVTMSAIRLVLSGGVYVPLLAIEPHDSHHSPLDAKRWHQPQNTSESKRKPGLTKRQCEILDLISLGKSNQEISEELGLTSGTVKAHLWRIFKTLKARNRTEAARIYEAL